MSLCVSLLQFPKLRITAGVGKILFNAMTKMLAFPLVLGVLLGHATVPLFEASAQDRISFWLQVRVRAQAIVGLRSFASTWANSIR